MNDVADVLRKALDVLRERGLAKWVLEDKDGRVCSRGALSTAMTGTPWWPNLPYDVREPHRKYGKPADDLLCEVVWEQWPERAEEPDSDATPRFNNHPDTTQDDVEHAFEKAIARAEEMGAE